MYRLLPLPALHCHTPSPPQLNDLLHHHRVTQGIVFTVEEQSWCGDGTVVEHLNTLFVKVFCVGLEEPEVQQGRVFYQPFQTWHQCLT